MERIELYEEAMKEVATIVESLRSRTESTEDLGHKQGNGGSRGGHLDEFEEEIIAVKTRLGEEVREGGSQEGTSKDTRMVCTLKTLPKRLLVKAAQTAVKVNPVNTVLIVGPLAMLGEGFQISEPLRAAMITSKYWGPSPRQLTVSFMESTPANLQARIISHMNAWGRTACISFAHTNGDGNVRISRGPGGYYSYLGTDILHVPMNRQTMNLEGFTMQTPEAEYKRVVRHETGHTLGFPHEHMRKELIERIDPEKAYKWFLETYGWDKPTVDSQVLTPLSEASLMATPAEETSIMCYQMPGAITKDGNPIVGGIDITRTDYEFAGKVYPKGEFVPWFSGASRAGEERGGDWPESEDPEVPL
jgi:hypothetical protein